jgi:3-deoxy-D-manno-octulosonic-acid transferase
MSFARLVYTTLFTLLVPLIPLRLLWRGRRQPAYLRHVGERFGFYAPAPGKPVVWVHAVSVGETRAAQPLVEALQARFPERAILITHMTPTGRETSEQLFGDSVIRCYLPYDLPFAVGAFLDHYRPTLGLIMETELWFNLVHACARRGFPLYLVNARLSERSARGYGLLRALSRPALRALAAVGAQTKADAKRLRALGAEHVVVTGNLKFDITPPESAKPVGKLLRDLFGRERPVLLLASTRDGEESLLLDACARIDVPELLIALVPRHPQRFDEVAMLLEKRGLRYQRRSAGDLVHPLARVVLGDTMGEMFAYCCAADVAVIGGSFMPYGGQNLIEACAVGTPVIIGPSVYNFAEAARRAVEAGAAVQVMDTEELWREAERLLKDATTRAAMGREGIAFSRAHRGATKKTLALLEFSAAPESDRPQ